MVDRVTSVHRFLPLVAAAMTIGLGGCALFGVPTEDTYPDDYEQAIIDLLDDSAIVVDHGAQVDGWERAANVPDRVAVVDLAEETDPEQLHGLLSELAALADQHSEEVPPMAYGAPFASVTIAGTYRPDEVEQVLETVAGGAWSSIAVWARGDDPVIQLRGNAQSAEEGERLATSVLPDYVADHLTSERIELPEGQVVSRLEGVDGPVAPRAVALAFELGPVAEDLPSPEDRLGIALSTEHEGGRPAVMVRTSVESDELRSADPDDRPALAERLGHREVCDRIARLAERHLASVDHRTSCTAMHVEIGRKP